jgi:hypothetical protein
MSIFDISMICLDCREREERHPLYPQARAAEEEAVRRGEMNFPGTGLPADLKENHR